MRSGFIFISRSCMPPDSNWKMPLVSPRQNSSKTFWSVRSMLLDVDAALSSIERTAGIESAGALTLPLARSRSIEVEGASRVVSVRRPRKSIFSRPTFSAIGPFELGQDVVVRCPCRAGRSVERLVGDDHAGRVQPALRQRPSSCLRDVDDAARSGRCSSYSSASLRDLLHRLVERHAGHAGDELGDLSVSASGTPSTRPTSLQAALAASVPKVMICATWPYLLRT